MIFKTTSLFSSSEIPKRFDSFLLFSKGAVLLMAMNACAPQQPAPEPEPTEAPKKISPIQEGTPTPTAQPNHTTFDPENPNWEVRYNELYKSYAEKFTPPTVGMNVVVQLKNGRQQRGILRELNDSELGLDLGNGIVKFGPAALTPESAAYFFRSAYARNHAVEQGRQELQRWKRQQASARQPPRSRTATAGTGNPASTPGQNGVDAPEPNSARRRVPKNEGPTGRVPQVEEYIRKNAAVPNSLKVKAWGPVQPNKNGYKVRVQYSLQAADGFGLSNEDMMFFMYSNGRVYRKAAVR